MFLPTEPLTNQKRAAACWSNNVIYNSSARPRLTAALVVYPSQFSDVSFQ